MAGGNYISIASESAKTVALGISLVAGGCLLIVLVTDFLHFLVG
jgi:hypothetical protein